MNPLFAGLDAEEMNLVRQGNLTPVESKLMNGWPHGADLSEYLSLLSDDEKQLFSYFLFASLYEHNGLEQVLEMAKEVLPLMRDLSRSLHLNDPLLEAWLEAISKEGEELPRSLVDSLVWEQKGERFDIAVKNLCSALAAQ